MVLKTRRFRVYGHTGLNKRKRRQLWKTIRQEDEKIRTQGALRLGWSGRDAQQAATAQRVLQSLARDATGHDGESDSEHFLGIELAKLSLERERARSRQIKY